MSGEKPLHVQVAEALGWRRVKDCTLKPESCWGSGVWPNGEAGCVPRYHCSWAATGPLIERFGVNLVRYQWDKDWQASYNCDMDPDGGHSPEVSECGASPLEAVCRLILALKAAGKLETTP